MNEHAAFAHNLVEEGFTRVERDDRLLDVYPKENREKGVELWQKWEGDTVHVIRIRLPFNEKTIASYTLSKVQLERDLLENAVREQLIE
ncbi:MAG: hypothetical protein WD200_01525 [Candidatus Andersenbacteria bacterium]